MPRFVGVLHVHSTLSDGNLTIEQLATLARAQDLDFVVLGEHADALAPEQVVSMVRTCAELSERRLLMMAGLEFELEGRHVLALGTGELLRDLDASTVIREPEKVRARGGLTVWAHPALTFAPTIHRPMSLSYDAWEVWNGRADGSSPSRSLMSALAKARGTGRNVRALAGTDFHDGQQFSGPFVVIDGPEVLTPSSLLDALRHGGYEIRGPTPFGQSNISSLGAERCPTSRVLRLASRVRYVGTRIRCLAALARHKCLVAIRLRQPKKPS
jgi:hypothetical protein